MRWRKRDLEVSDEYVRERRRERLAVMTALVRAQDRRDEVLAAVASAATDEAAEEALVSLLGLDETRQATAVLDMQLRRMNVPNSERMRAEYDELRRALGER